MALKLNQAALDHAKALITAGRFVRDDDDAWLEHKPSGHQGDEFIGRHGMEEYARWHLGIDEDQPQRKKARYTYPLGDFKVVHRCAVLAAEIRMRHHAGQEIQDALAQLHGMLEAAAEPRRHKVAGKGVR